MLDVGAETPEFALPDQVLLSTTLDLCRGTDLDYAKQRSVRYPAKRGQEVAKKRGSV